MFKVYLAYSLIKPEISHFSREPGSFRWGIVIWTWCSGASWDEFDTTEDKISSVGNCQKSCPWHVFSVNARGMWYISMLIDHTDTCLRTVGPWKAPSTCKLRWFPQWHELNLLIYRCAYQMARNQIVDLGLQGSHPLLMAVYCGNIWKHFRWSGKSEHGWALCPASML